MDVLALELPFPPSINHYYKSSGKQRYIGIKGRIFRSSVLALTTKHRGQFGDSRLHVEIEIYPPDKRKRDIDNIAKATLDALQHACIFNDDTQIDRLTLIRRDTRQNKIIVKIQAP